jgi:hypothetical protein
MRGCFEQRNTTTVTVSELPVGVWTSSYVEHLTKLLQSKQIEAFTNRSSDTTVRATDRAAAAAAARARARAPRAPPWLLGPRELRPLRAGLIIIDQRAAAGVAGGGGGGGGVTHVCGGGRGGAGCV